MWHSIIHMFVFHLSTHLFMCQMCFQCMIFMCENGWTYEWTNFTCFINLLHAKFVMDLYVVHEILSYQPWYQHNKWLHYACVDDWICFMTWLNEKFARIIGFVSKFWVELCFWLISWILHLLGFMVKIGYYMQLTKVERFWIMFCSSVCMRSWKLWCRQCH
jgi:hypothetical protein